MTDSVCGDSGAVSERAKHRQTGVTSRTAPTLSDHFQRRLRSQARGLGRMARKTGSSTLKTARRSRKTLTDPGGCSCGLSKDKPDSHWTAPKIDPTKLAYMDLAEAVKGRRRSRDAGVKLSSFKSCPLTLLLTFAFFP